MTGRKKLKDERTGENIHNLCNRPRWDINKHTFIERKIQELNISNN